MLKPNKATRRLRMWNHSDALRRKDMELKLLYKMDRCSPQKNVVVVVNPVYLELFDKFATFD